MASNSGINKELTPCKCHNVKYALPDIDRAHSLFRFEINRAHSFMKSVTGEKWRLDVPCAGLMAPAGFFFVGDSDTVRCFECFIVIGYWDDYINSPKSLMAIHSEYSSTCRFVRGLPCGNVTVEESSDATAIPTMSRTYEEAIALYANAPRAKVSAASIRFDDVDTVKRGLAFINVIALTNRPYANPLYAQYEDRLRSFDTWPATKTQTKEDMALVGFYYTGKNKEVECYQCGIQIRNWQPEYNPLLEHLKIFPMCQHIMNVINKQLTEVKIKIVKK